MVDWAQLIRSEFTEIPGMRLTKPQVRRLWNLDPTVCDAVLEVLERERFLRRTSNGTYMKTDGNSAYR